MICARAERLAELFRVGRLGIMYIYAPGKEISIFDYSQIIFSAIAVLIVFGQIPDTLSIVGYVIIFVIAMINYRYNLKNT